MSLRKLFKTSANLETDGIWIDYGPNDDLPPGEDGKTRPSIRFRIARAGGANQNFSKALERGTKPHRKLIQTGNLSNDKADQLYREAFVEAVLLGWENVTDLAGKPLAFSKENADQLLRDLPDLFTDLKETATNVSLFRDIEREADLGNSGRSLSTDSTKDQ